MVESRHEQFKNVYRCKKFQVTNPSRVAKIVFCDNHWKAHYVNVYTTETRDLLNKAFDFFINRSQQVGNGHVLQQIIVDQNSTEPEDGFGLKEDSSNLVPKQIKMGSFIPLTMEEKIAIGTAIGAVGTAVIPLAWYGASVLHQYLIERNLQSIPYENTSVRTFSDHRTVTPCDIRDDLKDCSGPPTHD